MLYMYIVENTTLQVESDVCVDYHISTSFNFIHVDVDTFVYTEVLYTT